MQWNKKGAIFDLDGTLLESMHVWDEVDRRFFEKRSLKLPSDYMKKITAMGFDKAARYTIERFNLKERDEDVKREWMDMAKEAYQREVRLKKHVRDYLERLRGQGIRIAAATSSSLELMEPCLRRNGIHAFFENITVTDEVARGKGFPDVYEKAAEKMGLPALECVVYEDLLKGIRGAKMGGFTTVGVFDETSASDREEIIREADAYIDHFGELLADSESGG